MKEEVKELAEKIGEKEDLELDEVMEMVEAKEEEYSGLISKEGAAHIVAKEAGIELTDREGGSLDIENIVPGMNSATVTGKVERIFEPREFETEDGKGKVANLILRDETGSVRFSLWNEEVERLIEEEKVEVGDTIKVENGYVTEDNRDEPELRLGRSGKVKESDEKIDVEVKTTGAANKGQGRMKIEDLSPGARCEIRGTIVNVFADSPFFKTCPECDKRVEEECEEHGDFEVNMALSAVVDDGTESIRTVFFGEEVEELVDVDTEDAWEMTDEGSSMEEFTEKCKERMGDEVLLQGRVKMNDFFGRPEFIANSIEEVDLKEETEKVLEAI
ncbi:MAG: OB-fold nucleic acid binding domain-containing protein [Candidatus Aenigmatarchaeota archaeon]